MTYLKPDNNTGSDVPESPEPMAFSASNCDAGFTFRQPVRPNADTVNHIKPLEVVTVTENSAERKRAKGHLDRPMPTSSPQKKRTRIATVDNTSLPQPSLLFPPSQSSTVPLSSDVFGIHRNNTLTSYWKVETLEEKTERNHRDFEELSRTREERERQEERASAIQQDRQKMHDQERQQKHRDGIREIKVANGWKPHQKRVSIVSAMLYY